MAEDPIDIPSAIALIFSEHSPERLIANLHSRVESFMFQGHTIVASMTDKVIPNNCYVVSPYALLIRYSSVELHKIDNGVIRSLVMILIATVSMVVRMLSVDKIQIINNYLLSTNIFLPAWDTLDIRELTRVAIARHPDHALAIRSLNGVQHCHILSVLSRNNWKPVVTRQVYLQRKNAPKRRDSVRDSALLQSSRYVFVDPEITELLHFKKAEDLYGQLYLTKYTEENIQYTALYLRELYVRGVLHLKLLKDVHSGEFVGVIGLVGDGQIVTAPIVGYQANIPPEEALYRRCLAYAVKYAQDRGLLFNMSSGAPSFKLNRGAVAEIEYMYVYTEHLSFARRVLWRVLSWVSFSVYMPILKRFKL